MPSSRVVCPWCSDHPVSERYFHHLNTKHHSLLWSGANKILLKTRITNKRTAPITISLPEPAHTIFACLGCMTACKSYKTAESHESSCREATLKTLSEWKMVEDESTDVIMTNKTSMNKLLDTYVNKEIKTLRKINKEQKRQLKEQDIDQESEDQSESDEDFYDIRDKIPKSLKKELGL